MKDHVSIRIESAAFEPDTVRVLELSGTETVSRLFELQLRLVSTDPAGFDEEKLLTSLVALVFERTSTTGVVTEERRIVGMICTLRDRALVEAGHREVLVTFVPRAWQTTLTKTSDIFMDLTVPQILQKKLEGIGLGSKDVELRLKGTYAPREFVVQYKESDHDFICRLAEDLGIHFFFEEKDGKDHLVFGDHNEAFKDSEPQAAPFHGRGDRTSVYQLEATRQVVPKQFKTRDYNYRNPGMDLLGEASNTTLAAGGVVDEFGPHAKTGEEATFYARIRAEEAMARHLTFEGESELPGLRAGSVLLVEGHPRGEMELAVIEVKHRATQASLGQAEGANVPYANTFRAIPMSVTYRPPRVTPRPVVHGVVTGVVESGAATNFGAIDEEGRYRVAFMYDTVSERGEGKASRPLRMAQPSAAADRGFHVPLKPGTEVVITCLNGDPDRPIIAGAVPNPQTPSPVTAANAEKSVWKTNATHVEIDDDQPRLEIDVGGEHQIQVGEPKSPEQGVMISSVKNVAVRAKEVATSYSKMKTAYTDWKTGTATKDILEAAGIPNPFSLWDKIEGAAEATAEFANAVGETIDAVQDLYLDYTTDAHEKKAAADAALAKKKKEIEEKLTKQIEERKGGAKIVTGKDGGAHYESVEEAKANGFANQLKDPSNKDLAAELEGATKDAAEADRTLKELREDHVGDDAKEAVEKGLAVVKKVGEVGKTIHEYAEKAKGAVKAVDAFLKKRGVKTLYSAISKVFSKGAHEALDATVAATQKVSAGVPKLSGERTSADVGSFSKPYNIQLARNSSALYGVKNAFVFGGSTATIFSRSAASLIGNARVDVKSRTVVEVAAKDVMLSSKELVDVYSKGKLKLVAHPHDKKIAIPGGYSMYLHAKEGILLDSVDKDIEVKVKKSFKVEAAEADIDLRAKKGNIQIKGDEAKLAVLCKNFLDVRTSHGDFKVEAEQGAGTIKTKKDLTLDCKQGKWNAAGNIDVSAKNVKVKGKKIALL